MSYDRASEPTSRPEALAVVIIDMQPEFLKALRFRAVLRLIAEQVRIIRECARQDVPVFVIEFSDEGETDYELARELARVPRVFRFKKTENDAFTNAGFEHALDAEGVTRLLLMGVNASYCVLETAYSARKKGYDVRIGWNLIADATCINFLTRWVDKWRSIRWYARNGNARLRVRTLSVL